MKLISLLLLLALTSCASNLNYDSQKNCSERALNYKAPKSSEADSKFYRANAEKVHDLFQNKLTPEFFQCYQNYLDAAVSPKEFAVCTMTVIQNGKVTFTDADDRVNGLSSELKTCLESVLTKANWSFYNRPSAVFINQPVILHAKRQ